MKKLLYGLFLLIPLHGYSEEFIVRDLSGGVYSNASSNQIPDNSAPIIQNFLTDIEPLAVERNGYVKRDTTVLGGTNPVVGLWSFTDSTGAEWIISFSSRTFYRNTIGTTPTAFGLSATVDQIPDAAINLGRIWFSNGTDDLWWFDGTSTGNVSSAPQGKLIEAWRNRIVIANITGSQSTVKFSEDGDGESWTIGSNATDPFQILIGGANDGQFVRCLKGSYLDSLIIGRKNDLWAVDGFDQSDVSLRNISLQVGCIEPNTMQEVDGALVFLSARGIESMTARSIDMISEPIRNVTDVIVRNTLSQRSNTQTTASDWGSGTQDQNVFFATNTYPGDLRPAFPDTFDSFQNGTLGLPAIWDEYDSGSTTGDVSASNGLLNLQNDGGALGRVHAYTQIPVVDWRAGTTFYFQLADIPFDTTNLSRLFFTLRTTTTTSNADSGFDGFLLTLTSTASAQINATVNYISGSSATPTGLTLTVPTTVQFYVSTTTWQLSLNGTAYLSGTHAGVTPQYDRAFFGYLKGSAGTGTCKIDNFRVLPKTAIFTSSLLSIGDLITSWGAVTISDTQTDGEIRYQFGSTTTADISLIVNWQGIVNGGVPTVSTAPYAAFRAILSTPTALTGNNISLGEFVTTWTEGTIVPSPTAWTYDRRYWISYTTNTATDPYQDAVFVWQRSKSWTMFKGINSASFATWRDNLYFGNSDSTGYVYKFDVGNNDDGANITSIITTKSYDLGQALREKDYMRSYINYLASPQYTGNFSVSYDIDRYGTVYSMGTASMSEATGLANIKFPFGLSQLTRGSEIQYNITKSGTGDRLRLYGITTQFQLKEER